MWNTENSRKVALAEGRYVETEHRHTGKQKQPLYSFRRKRKDPQRGTERVYTAFSETWLGRT